MGGYGKVGLSAGVAQLLFVLRAANMQLTTDQPFVKVFSGRLWGAQAVKGVVKSGAYNTACLGGIYTAPAKGGIAFVAATQNWSNLIAPTSGANAGVSAIAAAEAGLATTLFLSLSTGNALPLVADLFIFGYVLD